MFEATIAQQQILIDSLRENLSQAGTPCEVLETHISWVLLAGEFAYKIKKAVNFGFLDYSNLAQREKFCREEVRLNKRTAPNLYLDVVAIGGTPAKLRLGAGEAVEWAVKMRRFEQSDLLDRRLQENRLDTNDMEEIAASLARFHASVPSAAPDQPFGDPDAVYKPVADNFPAIHSTLGPASHQLGLEQHAAWAAERFQRLRPLIAQRKQQGYVRECHGDLHLGNMVQIDGRVVPFDAIEFNPALRWIDVASELAFTAMDLEARGHHQMARHLVNAYLERTGDYGAVPLLDFYKHYRAFVRAKVTALRYAQREPADTSRLQLLEEFGAYLALAGTYMHPTPAGVVLTFGVTGSGKTRVSGALVDNLPRAVRIRSDVERKRLFGLAADERTGSALGSRIYTPDATTRTYEKLRALALPVVEAGYLAIVDATFLDRRERESFHLLAQSRGWPLLLLAVTAPEAVLRERVAARLERTRDASEATLEVLDHQLAHLEPIAKEEESATLFVDSSLDWDGTTLSQEVEHKLEEQAKI